MGYKFDINEAFKELEMVEPQLIYEEADNSKVSFDLSDADDIDDLQGFLNSDETEDPIQMIVDLEAENEEELKDDYTDSIILQCPVCNELIYKDEEDLIDPEDPESTEQLWNAGDACPHCKGEKGFKLIGKVAPYVPEEEKEAETEEEIALEPEEDEVILGGDEETEESLDESLNEANNSAFNSLVDSYGEAAVRHILEVEKQRTLDTLPVTKIRINNVEELADYAIGLDSLDLISDAPEEISGEGADFYYYKKVYEALGADFINKIKNLTKNYKIAEEDMPKEIRKGNYKGINKQFENASWLLYNSTFEWPSYDDEDEDDEDDLDESLNEDYHNKTSQGYKVVKRFIELWRGKPSGRIHVIAERTPGLVSEHDYIICLGYNDNTGSWGQGRYGYETAEDAEDALKNGDGQVGSGYEVIEEGYQQESCEAAICEKCGKLESECSCEKGECKDSVNIENKDIEALDEKLFDSLANKYMHEIYENIESYETTGGSVNDSTNQIVLEGVIKFKSGKEQATKFIFESDTITKKGKVRLFGLNETFSTAKKAFNLKCTLNGTELLPEALTYNYKTKVLDESKTVYGRVINRLDEASLSEKSKDQVKFEADKNQKAAEVVKEIITKAGLDKKIDLSFWMNILNRHDKNVISTISSMLTGMPVEGRKAPKQLVNLLTSNMDKLRVALDESFNPDDYKMDDIDVAADMHEREAEILADEDEEEKFDDESLNEEDDELYLDADPWNPNKVNEAKELPPFMKGEDEAELALEDEGEEPEDLDEVIIDTADAEQEVNEAIEKVEVTTDDGQVTKVEAPTAKVEVEDEGEEIEIKIEKEDTSMEPALMEPIATPEDDEAEDSADADPVDPDTVVPAEETPADEDADLIVDDDEAASEVADEFDVEEEEK